MNLDAFNAADSATASEALRRCCSCSRWIAQLVHGRPYPNAEALRAAADRVWAELDEDDYLEAFAGHPQIGDIDSLREKYADTRSLAAGEQSGVSGADDETLQRLARGNQIYLERFGFIFIVCATGKSAGDMLELLEARLDNTRAQEIANAAEEQRKIFQIRLGQLL